MVIVSPPLLGGTTIFGGIASSSTNNIYNQHRGSYVASYRTTPEEDGSNSVGKIKSISAMPIYKDKSHQELRSQDYEYHKGSTFSSIQSLALGNSNAFQPSNSGFVPSSGSSSFGSACWPTVCIAPLSVNPPSGTSTGTVFGAPNNTSSTFCSNSANGSTSSIFGVSKVPAFAPGSGSCGFSTGTNYAFPSSSIFEGSNTCASQVTTTPGFGIRSMTSSVGSSLSGPKSTCTSGFRSNSTSASSGTCSIFGTQASPGESKVPPGSGNSGFSTGTFAFPTFQGSNMSAFQVPTTAGLGIRSTPSVGTCCFSGPKSTSCAMTTSGFQFDSVLSSRTSSIFGIPGSQWGATTPDHGHHDQGSRVAPYSATRIKVDGAANKNHSVEKFQSISAMPVYKDKSHEELRSEDYALLRSSSSSSNNNKGGQSSASAGFKTSSDTPQNIFRFPTLSNQPSVKSPFEPFKSQDLFTPNNTISMASTVLSPSLNNPFSPANSNPSQPQAFNPGGSHMPTFNAKLNPFSLIPTNSCQFPAVSKASPGLPLITFPSSILSSTVSPSTQSTSVSALGPWPSNLNASQPGQTAQKTDSYFTNNLSQPSQASNGLTMATEVVYQNINGQQYVPASSVGMQSSLAVSPFSTRSAIDRPNTVTSVQHGISSLPGSNNLSSKRNNLSSNRRTSLLRIRHVSSRHNSLPAQRLSCASSESKVPFFCDEVDRPGPVAPFLPRENPGAWIRNSLSLHSSSDDKGCEDKDLPSPSFQLNVNPTEVTGDTSILSAILSNSHLNDNAPAALMPKLPDGDEYYTEPSLNELAAKEMDEPGSCSRVNDFVLGRLGYGSIRFLGETDVRGLDLESVVQFNNREVIVYADDRKKPPVGQGLNKPAEVTMLNVKCISRKTGKQYVDGPQVQSYKEMLIKKASEQGVEFVSYDPVRGEWKLKSVK